MSTFVHLHVHTEYSMLQSAVGISPLIKRTKELGMGALAITDMANLCGAIDFYSNCLKSDKKKPGDKPLHPIIGCQMYVDSLRKMDENSHDSFQPLLLYAMDFSGYQNLCRLSSQAHLRGMYLKPRVNRAFLAENCAQLIALSAAWDGDIAKALRQGDTALAKRACDWALQHFGRDNFFIEIQRHGRQGEDEHNRQLIAFAHANDVPLVATNTVYYLSPKMRSAHEILLCIGEKDSYDATNARFAEETYYLRSPQEMEQLFADLPEAIAATATIAERCQLKFLLDVAGKEGHYPVYAVEPDDSQEAMLARVCHAGMIKRYGYDPSADPTPSDPAHRELKERLDFELSIINKTGYASYFLVVWDFILWSKKNDIPVGPGRGSGAGSIVAYLTGITNVDPIRYKLLFERFLNPERVSPPDFDIDFCERRRAEVIEYVRHKYGDDKVSQIGTYGTMKAKAAIKDVGRVLGRQLGKDHTEVDRITKAFPDKTPTIAEALDPSDPEKFGPDFKLLYDTEDWIRTIIDNAMPIEGFNRNMGIHAAGVIIGDQTLTNLVPLTRGQGGETVTQYDANPCERLGLLKMDFLGLRTLTLIKDAVDMIRERHGLAIDIETIPIDDALTYRLFQAGRTIAVFQYESPGMQKYMKELKPTVFDDLIAMNALYRPGPMDYIPSFINRKHGREPIEYDLAVMEEDLKDTYGVTVYQEQVMLLSQKIAGFSKGEADTLRKAMGKKQKDVLDKLKPKFIEQAQAKGHPVERLEKIWTDWEKFASYAFNKSHSTCYAWVAYQTAYLKAHYGPEFMAATMSSEMSDSERISYFISECESSGIKVKAPCVNRSLTAFSVDAEGAIRYALAAIKGVGAGASDAIVAERLAKGPYRDLQDLCERLVSIQAVNRKILECLIQTGACDTFGHRRAVLMQLVERVLQQAASSARDQASGQQLLFASEARINFNIPSIPEWDTRHRLQQEKALLGFYASGHPLGEWTPLMRLYSRTGTGGSSIAQIRELPPGRHGLRICGMVNNLRIRTAKTSGKPYAAFTLEDVDSSMDVMCFDIHSNMWALKEQAIIALEAEYEDDPESRQQRLVALRAIPLMKASSFYMMSTAIVIDTAQTPPDSPTLAKLQELIQREAAAISTAEVIYIRDEAMKMCKARPEIAERLERYLRESLSALASRQELEALLQQPSFGRIGQDQLLNPPQRQRLLQLWRDRRRQHQMVLQLKLPDETQVWLEPLQGQSFLPSQEFINEARKLLGEDRVGFRVNENLPIPRDTSWRDKKRQREAEAAPKIEHESF